MRRLPYGYRVEQGKVGVDPEQAARLRALFDGYLAGLSVSAARRAAGIPLSDKTCRELLTNRVYLGTERFPGLLEPDALRRSEEERRRRGRHLVGKTGRKTPELPIHTKFIFRAEGAPPEAPDAYAAWLYAGICPAGRGERKGAAR